jgi:hypothetical protein
MLFFSALKRYMTCHAIYWQKARTKTKDIGGSDRLPAVCVCERVKCQGWLCDGAICAVWMVPMCTLCMCVCQSQKGVLASVRLSPWFIKHLCNCRYLHSGKLLQWNQNNTAEWTFILPCFFTSFQNHVWGLSILSHRFWYTVTSCCCCTPMCGQLGKWAMCML